MFQVSITKPSRQFGHALWVHLRVYKGSIIEHKNNPFYKEMNYGRNDLKFA